MEIARATTGGGRKLYIETYGDGFKKFDVNENTNA